MQVYNLQDLEVDLGRILLDIGVDLLLETIAIAACDDRQKIFCHLIVTEDVDMVRRPLASTNVDWRETALMCKLASDHLQTSWIVQLLAPPVHAHVSRRHQ